MFYTFQSLLASWRRYDEQATQLPGSPQNFENIIEIAASNIEKFLALDSAKALRDQIDGQRLLAHLNYKYQNSIYRHSVQKYLERDGTPLNPNIIEALPVRLLFLRNLSHRFLARLTRYRLFSHVSEKGFSRKLLSDFGLTWPTRSS